MKKALAAVALLALTVAVLSASPVSAQEDDVSVTVVVGGEEVSDGERITVEDAEIPLNVTAESPNELNTLEASIHNQTTVQGINGTSHTQSYVVETRPGTNVLTVRATDVEGTSARFTVEMYDEPATPVERQRAVENLRGQVASVEREVTRLEERRTELEERQTELQDRLDSLSANMTDGGGEAEDGENGDGGSGDGEGGEGLPGFTALAALVSSGLFLVYRHRQT